MKVISNIIGIISGIISIVFAFVVNDMDIGFYESSYTYGGDAYTGIQNAAAQTANNVKDLADLVRTGLFGFLLVFGLAIICFFLSRLFEKDHVNENPIILANASQIESGESTVTTSPAAAPEAPSARDVSEEPERGAE